MPSERLRFRDIRNTSTFRLTLLLGLVALVGVAMLSVLIYTLTARELNARSDRILRAEAVRLMQMPVPALPEQIRLALGRNASGLNYYGLIDPHGVRIAGNLRGHSSLRLDRPHEFPARADRRGPIRLLAKRLPTGETLLIGRDATPLADLRRRVILILTASGFAIALLIVVAAVVLSLPPLRRVGRLQRIAHEIAAGRLERRMPILGRGDELDLLAGTVNGMVEEVGRVIGQVKSVTDAIAHDLRTPLTRMRSYLDRARRMDDADPATVARLDLAIADLDIVLERFAALLRISEIEAGSRRAGFGPLALDELLASVIDLYQPLAEERGILLSLEGLHGAVIHGDQSLLFEAFSNLVDNAIKFAPAGGQVWVSVARDGDGHAVEVRDNGPGIPEEQRKSVLRRFDRGGASSQIPGSGLGLSVVSAIAHMHQFCLSLADANPGLIIRISTKQTNILDIQQ